MLRTRAALILLGLIATFLAPITASAVSSNPTPVCSGATCTVTFEYSGDYYEWSTPHAGDFTLEVWGAQGGGTGTNYWGSGGKGGFAKGTASLTAGQRIYIYVGQQGFLSDSVRSFNGGGWGVKTNGYSSYTGGGATHIATSAGSLSTLSSSVSNVLIVGGGGGGAAGSGNSSWNAYRANGGVGGGTSGLAGSHSNGETPYRQAGAGGTQSAGGASGAGGGYSPAAAAAFGAGANGTSAAQDGISGGGGGGGFYGGGAGSDAGGGGGGGSGYVGTLTSTTLTAGNASMPNLVGGTMNGRSGDGVARITYENSPSVSNFSTSQSSPTNISTSGTISYSLVLSQSVSDLATGDFQLAGTSTCNTPGLSGSGTTYTVTLTTCSEGTVILQLKANSVTGTSAGPTSLSSANSVVIDRTGPTISAVHSIPTGTYYPGSSITFNLAVSETVTVSGLPRIPLTVGSVTRYATYSSGSNSKILSFVYTIASDKAEVDTDNVVMNSPVELNSGSITDLASNAMLTLTYTVSPLTLIIAQTPSAPTISSITPSNGTLSVAFTAGASNGSSITNYQYSTDNGSNWTTRSPTATTSPISISGLTNGTAYNVRIRAVNAAGNGDSSTAVSATPSAVVVSGDATLTTTYGSAASTSTYTSSGGTSPYTYTLSATPSGVSISGGVVTASASTAAGTYTQNVVATDSAGTPQTGQKQLVITVNKASTTITISLPNGATDAALGGAITITATVSQAGSVNFKLGGSSISGCSSVSSSAGTATCSWTPGALGGASLTAVLTPSNSSNYEVATTTTLSITVVNGVTNVSIALAGGVTQAQKSRAIVITATVDQAGRITFFVDGRKIPGCSNLSVSGSTKNCTWKPAVQKAVTLTSRLVPTNSAYSTATGSLKVLVVRRTGTR